MHVFEKILYALRCKDWWHHLILPVLSFYFLGLYLEKDFIGAEVFITQTLTFFVLTITIAAFGFFVNEWTDIQENAKANRKNYVAQLSVEVRWIIFVSISVLLISFLLSNNFSPVVKGLVIFELFLLILYSCPPIRLKNNWIAAMIIDALYCSTIPFLTAVFVSLKSIPWGLFFLIFCFGFFKGLRNIIYHFQINKDEDKLSGQITIAHKTTISHLYKIQQNLWFLEAIFIILIGFFISNFLGVVILTLCLLSWVKRRFYLNSNPLRNESLRLWLGELNTIYELWLPVLAVTIFIAQYNNLYALYSFVVIVALFPKTLNICKETYILLYNFYYLLYRIYYVLSDTYFIRIKPVFDVKKNLIIAWNKIYNQLIHVRF